MPNWALLVACGRTELHIWFPGKKEWGVQCDLSWYPKNAERSRTLGVYWIWPLTFGIGSSWPLVKDVP